MAAALSVLCMSVMLELVGLAQAPAAHAATPVSTKIAITSSIGVPDRGDTALAYDGNLGTATYTTPSNAQADPAYLEFGFASTPVNRYRIYKDNYVGPHNLTIQYTTDTGSDLTARTWTNVTNLTNGFQGTELLQATSVNSGGTVTADRHDSSTNGWASLTFDTITATGLRIAFSQAISCCNHYHVFEFEAHYVDYPPTSSIALTPASPSGSNGWYISSVHATVAAVDNNHPAGILEIRCVLDPTSPPASFSVMPVGCGYVGTGADVTTDGKHILYAASNDAGNNPSDVVSSTFNIDRTAPSLACDALPTFVLGGPGGNVTATVSDTTSGPAISPAAAPADVSSAGKKSVLVTGFDNAGNSSSVSCPYMVAYNVVGFSALNGTIWKRGSPIVFTFALANAAGTPISDTEAQALAAHCGPRAKFPPVPPVCATYSATTHAFRISIKTSLSTPAPRDYPITLKIYIGHDLVNLATAIVHITR